MPIYEYSCKACGEKFEQLVMSSGEQVRCPECGSADVDKLISSFRKLGSSEEGGGSASSCSGCTATSCEGCST